MRQVLFEIPLPFGDMRLPLFGFGTMMVVAFFAGTWAAGRRARAEGVNPDHLWDIALWIFIGGLIGARVLSLMTEPVQGGFWEQVKAFPQIWNGGMVFYGAVIGGFLAYGIAYVRVVRPNKISTLKLADVIAPSIALGIFFGRIGCFLNGCCWGDVADPVRVPAWLAVQFPANSPPQRDMVGRGYQTGFGFVLAETERPPQHRAADEREVQAVEPESAAARAGLRPGDRIVKVGDTDTATIIDLHQQLVRWPAREPLRLTVDRGGERHEIAFEPPPSLPLHPAQLYSSLDGLVLFFLLTAYYPFRRRPGQVMALLMMTYAINRFLIEMLRLDNPPTWFGLTISQNISLAMVLAGAALWFGTRLARVPTGDGTPGKASVRP
jgi:phosphatidylglycerol:prolipoprotein diacylglycerol transferase